MEHNVRTFYQLCHEQLKECRSRNLEAENKRVINIFRSYTLNWWKKYWLYKAGYTLGRTLRKEVAWTAREHVTCRLLLYRVKASQPPRPATSTGLHGLASGGGGDGEAPLACLPEHLHGGGRNEVRVSGCCSFSSPMLTVRKPESIFWKREHR